MGYGILAKQETPPATWMLNARTDLAEEYDALRKPDEAAKYRAELTVAVQKNPSANKKN
jgi:hypothetical protein